MKTIIDPKEHASVLAQWCGAQAQIWTFHLSLKRMAIKLMRDGEMEAIIIVAVACKHISGPFSWKEADVSIILDPPGDWQGETRHRVIDKKAGFELLCGGVALARGPSGVLPNPFENFIDDAK